MADPSTTCDEGKYEECPSSHDAHDITSLSDLPGKRMKTKLWPMSPIESLTAEEVMAIANRDQTPIMIAVVDGDDNGEKYLCANKRGVTLPPEVAAEGSWAKKYYQQVAVLNNSIKEMQESFQPVWELAKGQQALLVSVEVFDGLLAVANQGLQLLYKSWTHEDMKAIITRECDFRVQKQVHYYSVLKNYTMGRFSSLDQARLQSVEDLLLAGETYLIHHARTNGFECPSDIRALFQEFLPLKRDRNEYSHPLTLARKRLASTVLQKLRASVVNDEFDFIKGTKNLILLGADYAESVLQSYGKVRQKLFLDPKRRNKQKPGSNSSPDDSPRESPPHSPRSHHPLFGQDFQVGQSSQTPQSPPYHPSRPRARPSQSPENPSRTQINPSPAGSPPNTTGSHDSLGLHVPNALSLQIPEPSQSFQDPDRRRHCQSPLSSPSLGSSPTSDTSAYSQSSETEHSEPSNSSLERRFKRKRH
ncbi:unnamed protein product [Calypogeia fissa]